MAVIGTFPSSPGFSAANFKQNTITKKTQTASGRVIRATNSTTLWSGTLAFPVMSLAEFRPVQAFVALAQGPLNEFDIVIPTVSTSQADNPGTLTATVNGNQGAGATAVSISTNKNSTVVLKAGDVIRFTNHTKVYMVTADATTNGSGNVDVSIAPALVQNVSNTESITTTNVPFRMILSNDIQEFNYRTDNRIAYEIDVEEVL